MHETQESPPAVAAMGNITQLTGDQGQGIHPNLSSLLNPPPKADLAKIDVKAVALSRFGSWRAGAAALVAKFANVAFDVRTTKGYDEAKKALAEVRAPRYAAQNVSKASKAELAAVSKAVGAEEQAVIDFLAATEKSIKDQIDAEDARRAEEKAKRERAEAERKARAEANIAAIRNFLVAGAGLPSERLMKGIEKLELMAFGEDWMEFKEPATKARDETLAALKRMHAETVEAERRAEEAEERRLENERVAAELAEKQRQIDAQLAELAAAKAAQEAKERAAAAPAPQPTPAPEQAQEGTVTTPSGIVADAKTGEILEQPVAVASDASPPATQAAATVVPIAPPRTSRAVVRRAEPPPVDRILLLAEELGLRFGVANAGGFLFTTKGLADLIDHVKSATKE